MRYIGSLSLLCLALLVIPSHVAAGPRAFKAFRCLSKDQKELLQGSITAIPLADVRSTLEEHADYLGLSLRNTKYIAPKGVEEFDATTLGQWAESEGGGLLWSLSVKSSGAKSQMLLFSKVALHGGELVLFSPNQDLDGGECGVDCMIANGTRVHESGKLTSIPISGPEIRMLYYHPAQEGFAREAFELQVLYVMQEVEPEVLADTVESISRRRLQQEGTSPSSQVVGTMLPVHLIQQNSSSLMQCTPSIECQPQYEHLASAVVAIYAVDPQSHTVSLCSGSLVRPPARAHYLLTADHCLRNKTNLEGFEFWLTIFNYQAPCGWSPIPPIEDVMQGVRLAYYNYEADVLLLTMTNVIPDHFAAYEIGFDASRDAVPKRAVGIHHPGGVPTAISTVEAGGISTVFPAPNFPMSSVQPTQNTHFQVTWGNGATIGGSSGSPLIDVTTQKVVGVLTGGYTNCHDRTQSDYYGRLSACWEKGLYQYLSSQVQLQAGSDYAQPRTLSLMRAQNTAPGANATIHGPSLGVFPSALHYLPNITSQRVTYFLTDPPRGNSTLHLTVEVINQRGNAIDVTPHVLLDPREKFFTAADYGVQFTSFVNLTGFDGPEFPSDLIRFAIVANITSLSDSKLVNTVTTKGIIQNSRTTWTQFKPVAVPRFPYIARSPIASPSGRAVFHVTAGLQQETNLYADVAVCLTPEAGISVGDGTVTAYRNQSFIWTLTPYEDPFGHKNCLYIPAAFSKAQKEYDIVVSDADDLNAVLNITTVQLIYLDYTNASIASSLFLTYAVDQEPSYMPLAVPKYGGYEC